MDPSIESLPNTPSTPRKKNKLRRFITILLLLIFAGSACYYFICGLTYSEGTRSGILTKVSKKGILFKTYEGEMNVGGLSQGDGTIMPLAVFKFSVREKTVYDELEQAQGEKVVLHYKQVIKSFFWQGEQDYFVYQISHVH